MLRPRHHPDPALPAASRWSAAAALALAVAGCNLLVDDADRQVYRLIDQRQEQALGQTRSSRLDQPQYPEWSRPDPAGPDSPYAHVPNPRPAEVPEAFRTTTQPTTATSPSPTTAAIPDLDKPYSTADGLEPPAVTPATPADAVTSAPADAARPDQTALEGPDVMTLEAALAYAHTHAREYQTAKEDLYLAALALSLERHLWTPQLTGEIRTRYANYGEIRDFDQAMDAVAELAVAQRLPYGGQVTASVLGLLMRDLTNHLTSGESGQAVLAADLPLLRGAGRVARESLYQAERDLIYAVRAFERFRQNFAVEIAGDYFDLQQLQQEILNTSESIKSFKSEEDRARALWTTGRLLGLEVQRAEQDRLRAINRRVDAIETYQSALDAFKIRIGMPIGTHMEVELFGDPSAELQAGGPELAPTRLERTIRMPAVALDDAVAVGLRYRLDLLNDYDRIDDTRRGVEIARNALLPELAANASVTYDTDPDRLSTVKYGEDRATWRAGMTLEIPLDRVRERNALRESLIVKQRAQRNYIQAREQVALQVRRAMRRVEQQQESLRIQILSRDLALQRRQSARIRFDQGRVSNREVVDAENALLEARNALAAAQAQVRLAVLQFWRDTGTLMINDAGNWR